VFVIEVVLPKCIYPFTHDSKLIKPILEALPLTIYKSWFRWSNTLNTFKFKLTDTIKRKWKQFWLTTETSSIYPLCNTRAILGYDKDIWLRIVKTGLTEKTYIIKCYLELDNYQPVKDLLELPASLAKVCAMVTVMQLSFYDTDMNKLWYQLADMICKDLVLIMTSRFKERDKNARVLKLIIFSRMKSLLKTWTDKRSKLRRRFELVFLAYGDSESIYYYLTADTYAVTNTTFAIFNLFLAKDESRHTYWRSLCRHHKHLVAPYK